MSEARQMRSLLLACLKGAKAGKRTIVITATAKTADAHYDLAVTWCLENAPTALLERKKRTITFDGNGMVKFVVGSDLPANGSSFKFMNIDEAERT